MPQSSLFLLAQVEDNDVVEFIDVQRLSNGHFIATWRSTMGNDRVLFVICSDTGVKITPTMFAVGCQSVSGSSYSYGRVLPLPDGTFRLFCLVDNLLVYETYDNSGALITPSIPMTTNPDKVTSAALTQVGDHHCLAWTSYAANATALRHVYIQCFQDGTPALNSEVKLKTAQSSSSSFYGVRIAARDDGYVLSYALGGDVIPSYSVCITRYNHSNVAIGSPYCMGTYQSTVMYSTRVISQGNTVLLGFEGPSSTNVPSAYVRLFNTDPYPISVTNPLSSAADRHLVTLRFAKISSGQTIAAYVYKAYMDLPSRLCYRIIENDSGAISATEYEMIPELANESQYLLAITPYQEGFIAAFRQRINATSMYKLFIKVVLNVTDPGLSLPDSPPTSSPTLAPTPMTALPTGTGTPTTTTSVTSTATLWQPSSGSVADPSNNGSVTSNSNAGFIPTMLPQGFGTSSSSQMSPTAATPALNSSNPANLLVPLLASGGVLGMCLCFLLAGFLFWKLRKIRAQAGRMPTDPAGNLEAAPDCAESIGHYRSIRLYPAVTEHQNQTLSPAPFGGFLPMGAAAHPGYDAINLNGHLPPQALYDEINAPLGTAPLVIRQQYDDVHAPIMIAPLAARPYDVVAPLAIQSVYEQVPGKRRHSSKVRSTHLAHPHSDTQNGYDLVPIQAHPSESAMQSNGRRSRRSVSVKLTNQHAFFSSIAKESASDEVYSLSPRPAQQL